MIILIEAKTAVLNNLERKGVLRCPIIIVTEVKRCSKHCVDDACLEGNSLRILFHVNDDIIETVLEVLTGHSNLSLVNLKRILLLDLDPEDTCIEAGERQNARWEELLFEWHYSILPSDHYIIVHTHPYSQLVLV